MAIYSFQLPIPAEQASEILVHINAASDSFMLKAIPAEGGCVVAAIPISEERTARAATTPIRRWSLERRLLSLQKAVTQEVQPRFGSLESARSGR